MHRLNTLMFWLAAPARTTSAPRLTMSVLAEAKGRRRVSRPRAAKPSGGWPRLVTLLTLLLLTFGCKVDEGASPGKLVIATQTDMSVPDGIDEIRLRVTADGETLLDKQYDLPPRGKSKIPFTVTLEADAANGEITVALVGLKDAEPLVFAQAVTEIPKDRVALLNLPLQYLCLGSAKESGDFFTSTCSDVEDEPATCIAGSCAASTIDESSLPDYEPGDVFGGASGPDVAGACFDTQACFTEAAPVVPNSDCVVQLDVPNGREPNVALVLAKKQAQNAEAGICGERGCLVPLQRDPRFGYDLDAEAPGAATYAASIVLPKAVCEGLSDGAITDLVVSTACQTKTSKVPTCGPWSSTARSLTVTLDTASPDAGTLDGGFQGTSDAGDANTPLTVEIVAISGWDGGVFTVGQAIELVLSGVDPDAVVEWASSDESVATVDANGRVKIVGTGKTVITATVDGLVVEWVIDVPDGLVVWWYDDVVSLMLDPADLTLPVGASTQVTARGTLESGATLDGTSDADWTSADPSVATVNAGLIEAVGPGATTVTASLNGLSAVVAVTVTDAALELLIVEPSYTSLPAGVSAQLRATGIYDDGSSLDLTHAVSWSSSDPAVAEVDDAGYVAALAEGDVFIFANFDGQEGEAQVHVTDAELVALAVAPDATSLLVGQTRTFTALASFSDGQTVDVSELAAWTSSDESRVSFTGATALARAPGAVTVSAGFQGESASAELTVRDAQVVSLDISPKDLSLPLGARATLRVEAAFEDGTSADVTRDVEWSTANPAIGTVLSDGTFIPSGKGTVSIFATLGDVSDEVQVTVTDATLLGLLVLPEEVTLVAGRTVQLSVLASYSDGSNVDVTALTAWMTDSSVASVNAAGVLRGNREGTTLVRAIYAGQTAPVSVTVTDAELLSISVLAPQTTAPVGQTIALSAQASYSDGSTVVATSEVIWSSNALDVATVNSAGQVFGKKPGPVSVTARLGTISGSVDLEITDAVLTGVLVSPDVVSLAKGRSVTATLLAQYSDGSSGAPESGVEWTSETPAIAGVRGGQINALRAGKTRIIGAFGGYSGAVEVTVTDAVPTALTVTPEVTSAPKGARVSYAAVISYSDGSSSAAKDVTWRSLTPNTASVNAEGVARAADPGTATIQGSYGDLSDSASFEVTPATVAELLVSPAEETTPVGRSVRFVATAVFTDGIQRPADNVVWTSSNSATATVDASGLADGKAPGKVTITATASGKSGAATLTVSDAVLSSLQLSPLAPSLPVGGEVDFRVDAIYSDGTQKPNVAATFTSSDTKVLVVNSASGVSKGTGKGTATVTARFDGRDTSTTVTVSDAVVTDVSVTAEGTTVPVGQTIPLKAWATYSDGRSLDVTSTATWLTDTSGNAAVLAGVVTGKKPGDASITASYAGKSGSVVVKVTEAVVERLDIEAETTTLPVGRSTQLQARAYYSDGSSKLVTTETAWTRASGDAVSVGVGLITGLRQGNSTVKATFASVSSEVGMTVTTAVVTGLSISPLKESVIVRNTVRFTATATYSDNTFQVVTESAGWSTGNGQVASVASGEATGVSAGNTEVKATYQGYAASAELSVVAASVTRVDVVGEVTTIPVGRTLQLTATAVYNDGRSVDVTKQANWRSSNTQIATVESGANGGRVRGVSGGNATIYASFGGKEGSAAISVSRAVLESVRVAPASLTLVEGLRGNFTLQAAYSDGSNQDVTSSATWTSKNTSVASFAAPGLVQAGKSGTADVQADYGGLSAFALVTVNRPDPVRLAVDPAVVSLPAGTNTPVRVTVYWSNETTSDVTTLVTWATTNASVATVSADKRVIQAGATQSKATLTATYLTVSGTSDVTVTSPLLTSLVVSPATANVTQKLSVALTATGTLSDGSTANLTSKVKWSSGNTAVATVSAAGLVTGVSASATPVVITADYQGTVATANITVSAPRLTSVTVEPAQFSVEVNKTATLKAFANYDNSDKVDVTGKATWTSENTKILAFNSAGIVQGISAGTATVTAEFNQVKGTAAGSVTAAPVVRIDISPSSTSVLLDASVKLQARAFDAAGTYLGDVSDKVTWSADDKYVKVNTTGTAAGIAVGQGSVKAKLDTLEATASVNVYAVERLVLVPSDSRLVVGVPAAIMALALLTDGTVLDVSNKVEWGSSNQAIPVSKTGEVLAREEGDASITVSLGKVSTKGSVVAVKTESYLEIVPNVLRLSRDATATVQVFLVDPKARVDVTTDCTFRIADSKVASVVLEKNGAVVTGVGLGGTLLEASYSKSKLSAAIPVSVVAKN